MLQKIIEITAETLGAEAESITENTSFTENLHADSLDLLSWQWPWKRNLE